jgi:hypothetical protein
LHALTLLRTTHRQEWREYKLVYKRYASLYFCVGVDPNDNELITLEARPTLTHAPVPRLRFRALSFILTLTSFPLSLRVLSSTDDSPVRGGA